MVQLLAQLASSIRSARRIFVERLIRLNTTLVSGLLRKIDWHINSL
jgi:hypothetical protein